MSKFRVDGFAHKTSVYLFFTSKFEDNENITSSKFSSQVEFVMT